MTKKFTTKFGHDIPIIENYRMIHGKTDYSTFEELLFNKEETFYEQRASFLSDLVEYSIVFEYLESLGIKKKFETALDIGGQQGYVSKIITAEGKSKYSDCVEIFDYRGDADFQKFISYYKKLKFLSKNKFLRKNRKINRIVNSVEEKGRKFGKHTFDKSKLWNIDFNNKGKIRDYILKDVYDVDKKYDLVTSLLCLVHFEYKQLFKKINELLNENGIFVFLDSYWWWPVNPTRVIGDFPYSVQRLTKDDLIKYFEEFHPDEKKDVLKKIEHYYGGLENKPSVQTFIEEAEKNGLSLVGYQRFMPNQDSHLRTPITPKAFSELKDFSFSEILRDIHEFRKDVNIEDLKTAFVLMVFKKVEKKESIVEKISYLKDNRDKRFIK